MKIRWMTAFAVLVAACTGGGGTGASTSSTTTTAPTTVTVPATTATTAVAPVEPPADPIVVWVENNDVAEAVEERGDAYEAATGVQVEVHVFDPADLPEPEEGEEPLEIDGLLDAVLAGVLDPLPDAYIGEHTWLFTLAEAGLLEPVDLLDGLPESITDAVSLRGFALGVPLTVDGVVQVRNRALMPTAPEAIETIPCPDIDLCLVLPATGDADLHYPFLVAAGGFLFPEDGLQGYDRETVGVDSTEAIAGATILDVLLAENTIDSVGDQEAAIGVFVEGGAALIWITASDITAVRASGMDISIEVLPTIGGGPAITPFRILTGFVDPHRPDKAETRQFVVEWLGDLNGSTALATDTATAPVWRDGAGGPLGTVFDSAEAGEPVPYVSDIDEVWGHLATAFGRIHTGTSPESAMGSAGAAIRP